MSVFLIALILLLSGGLALLYFPWKVSGGSNRDTLNRTFYQARLQELEQENPDTRGEMVVELQRTLLADIPGSAPETTRQPVSRWVLLPGALALVLLSVGIYLKTSDIGQVLLWQQAEHQFPQLLQRAKDPGARPLRMDEIAELRLGLRSQLQKQPDDLAGWQMLGRIGMVLDDGETAIGAFARAHQLAANDPSVTFDYANALVRAGDKGQAQMAAFLLRDLLQRQPKNLSILELLALCALRNEDYPQVVETLQRMLVLLPPDDPRREAISRQLSEAQKK
ncbi:c-type cytochrome biogenesis protein CcmI [Klebsiella indica]|uniref:c-type cytochrome biogenesis protein CcmI n=1 Tax=Klebsiella TaxID=570 RepID=UPI0011573AC4|nr:c-type cytochrome biogenesis protein CcmI [Klebsiella sp. 2680]